MKILIVTPGITYCPGRMGNSDSYLTAKAEGVTDQCAYLFSALAKQGLDIHIAMPNYRSFDKDKDKGKSLMDEEISIYRKGGISDKHLHLVENNRFIYMIGSSPKNFQDNASISFALQREVLKEIIPTVKPKLIHCNDWVTGLIPAATRNECVPCLLTLHNIQNYDTTLSHIEAGVFNVQRDELWRRFFFKSMPNSYHDAKTNNSVDLLTTAIFNAHFIHTGSPTFLEEIASGRHNFIPGNIVSEITNKKHADCAAGIPIPINPECGPQSAEQRYQAESATQGKLANKRKLQAYCGLEQIDSAPLFLWPSRLDAHQKGCHLLTDILYEMVDRFWKDNLQIIIVARGVYERHFKDIVDVHSLSRRVAVLEFDEELKYQNLPFEALTKLAYAASDFTLLPSLYEPCGLTPMESLIYGTLPVAHDTGGLHDSVKPLRVDYNDGNGFLFQVYNSQGLRWAFEQAMSFYRLPIEKKAKQIRRIMKESQEASSIDGIASQYVSLYEKMLNRKMNS